MTVLLLQPYNGNAKGAQVDYDNATEASIVAQGIGRYSTNPGSSYYPLVASEQQALRDMLGTGAIIGSTGAVVETLTHKTLTIAGIGDSLIAQYSNPGSGQNLIQLQDQAYLTQAQRFSLGRMQVTQMLAVAGSRLDAAILQVDGLDGSARVVIEDAGVNDIIGDDATVDVCMVKKLSLWRKIRGKGYDVVSISVLPVAAAGGGTLAKNQKINDFNERCDLLAQKEGVIRVNLYSGLVNPTDANGYPNANVTYDGLHLSNTGSYPSGKTLWNALNAAFPGGSYQLASSVLDGYVGGTLNNVWVENPLFQGTAGTKGAGVTGTVPDGYDVSVTGGAAVCSIIADPSGFGNALQIVYTPTGSGQICEVKRIATGTGPVALNDTIYYECVGRVTAGVSVGSLYSWMLIQTNTGNSFAYGGNSANQGVGIPADNVPLLLNTPQVQANNLGKTGVSLTALASFVDIVSVAASASTVLLSQSRGRRVV